MSIHLVYWILVGFVGLWMGWRTLADDPARPVLVLRALGASLLWCMAAQVILVMAYLGLVTNGGVLDAPFLIVKLALIAGMIWGPLVVIGALWRNARERSS